MNLTIEVTAQDIANGQRFAPRLCPIGLAAFRALGQSVSVAYGSFRTWEDGSDPEDDSGYYALPEEARDFMAAFDRREKVGPITFEAQPITAGDAIIIRRMGAPAPSIT